MRLHAVHGEVVPALAERALDDADRLFRVASSTGPCSMCASKYAPTGCGRAARCRRSRCAASASRTDLPSLSFARESVIEREAPANTPEPIITGTKREPSSFVHTATSSGASVSMFASVSVRSTSSPASTP